MIQRRSITFRLFSGTGGLLNFLLFLYLLNESFFPNIFCLWNLFIFSEKVEFYFFFVILYSFKDNPILLVLLLSDLWWPLLYVIFLYLVPDTVDLLKVLCNKRELPIKKIFFSLIFIESYCSYTFRTPFLFPVSFVTFLMIFVFL